MSTQIKQQESGVNDRNDVYSFPKTLTSEESIEKERFSSTELSSIYKALSKAQAEMDAAKKDSKAYNYKYADLSEVVRVSRAALFNNDLCVIQRLLEKEDKLYLYTRLCHSSGQWIESRIGIDIENATSNTKNIQALGSAITYLRRYSYSSILGIITEEDDDGKRVMDHINSKMSKETYSDTISKQELETLSSEFKDPTPEMKSLVGTLLSDYKIKKFSELKSTDFPAVLKKVLKTKNNQS